MPERWLKSACTKLLWLFFAMAVNTVFAQTTSGGVTVHPQAKAWCHALDLGKRILVGNYLSGGFELSMHSDLTLYRQKDCERAISQLITQKSEIVLTAPPSLFDVYAPNRPEHDAVFDYTFLCASTRMTSLTLSAVNDWDILQCLQHKDNIDTLILSNFTAVPLNLSRLSVFKNLRFLSLTHGQVVNETALGELTSLKSLTLNNVELTTVSYEQLKQLKNLESLRLQRVRQVDVTHLAKIDSLRTLALVYLPKGGIHWNGIETMTALTTLNLQGNLLDDSILTRLQPLPKLTRLNLSDNAAITTVAPLVNIPNLKQLNITNTAVSDIAPLASHASLFAHPYSIGYSLQYSGSEVIDLTGFYENGGINDGSAHLLGCSPTSATEYEAGKRCNDAQRQNCQPASDDFFDHFISAPLCVWWHGD